MHAQLKEIVQGSQVLAGVMHTYGDSQSYLKHTSQGAGLGQPRGGRWCAHLCTQSTQMQAQLWVQVQGSHVLAGVVHTYGDSQ